MFKRHFLRHTGLALVVLAGLPWVAHAQGKPLVEVWKSPTCGCCHDWITHMQASGSTSVFQAH